MHGNGVLTGIHIGKRFKYTGSFVDNKMSGKGYFEFENLIYPQQEVTCCNNYVCYPSQQYKNIFNIFYFKDM